MEILSLPLPFWALSHSPVVRRMFLLSLSLSTNSSHWAPLAVYFLSHLFYLFGSVSPKPEEDEIVEEEEENFRSRLLTNQIPDCFRPPFFKFCCSLSCGALLLLLLLLNTQTAHCPQYIPHPVPLFGLLLAVA